MVSRVSSPTKGPAHLEEMTRLECLERLGTTRLGRIGINIAAMPVILPVNFVLLDGAVVFRTAIGTKLAAATSKAVVAFEVDSYEPEKETGWSVLVIGISTHVTDTELIERAEQLLATAWSPTHQADHVVQIETEQVTGRKFGDTIQTRFTN